MIQISSLTDDEITQVAELDRENVSSWAILHFKHYINTPHTFFFVAKNKETDETIGFVCGQHLLGEAEVHKIAVAKAHRRKAIATTLLHHTLQFLKRQQTTLCVLELRRSNKPAHALYETFGFQPVHVRKKYYNSPPEDAIIMELHNIFTP